MAEKSRKDISLLRIVFFENNRCVFIYLAALIS